MKGKVKEMIGKTWDFEHTVIKESKRQCYADVFPFFHWVYLQSWLEQTLCRMQVSY